jgi:hypothetical protein
MERRQPPGRMIPAIDGSDLNPRLESRSARPRSRKGD